jgi:hypothetical protein
LRIPDEFADKVPEGEFSPAEIQSFLVEIRESSRMAVENVEHWMTRTRQEKAKRADGVNEIEILADPTKEQQNLQKSVHMMERRMLASPETTHAALPSPSCQPTSPDSSVKEQQLVTMDQVERRSRTSFITRCPLGY